MKLDCDEITKKRALRTWQKSRQYLGEELFHERCMHKLELKDIAKMTGLPEKTIEHQELGYGPFDIGSLLRLARLYGKIIQVEMHYDLAD